MPELSQFSRELGDSVIMYPTPSSQDELFSDAAPSHSAPDVPSASGCDRDQTRSSARKRAIEMWAPQKYRDMADEGRSMVVRKDVVQDEQSILDETDALRKKVDDMISSWTHKPTAASRRALLVLALSIEDDCVWNKMNEVLLAKLFALIFGIF